MDDSIKQLYFIVAYEGNIYQDDLKKNHKLECMIVPSDNIDAEFENWETGNCKNLEIIAQSADGFNITHEHKTLLEKFKPQHVKGNWYRLTAEHIQYVLGYFDALKALKAIQNPKPASVVTGGNPYLIGSVQHFIMHIKQTRPAWYCGEEWILVSTIRSALENVEGAVSDTYLEQVLDALIPGGYTPGSINNGGVLRIRVKPIYDLCP